MPHYDFDVVIRGATVGNATSTHVGDVGVKSGRIAGVAPHLNGRGASEIDGVGKVLVPGGIDPHTHFATPSPDGALMSADDYESGTRAAAAGGVTTIINYAFQQQGESLAAALHRERIKADGRAHIDYAFHPILTDLRGGRSLHELTELVAAGYPSVKIFTTYDPFRVGDREAIAVLDAAGKAGALVNVHAEDDGLTHFLTETLSAVPATAAPILNSFRRSRPASAEALAIQQIALYAATVSCPVYFVHLSSRAAVQAVRRGRAAGAQVFAEVRPAYLFLDETRYDRADGNHFVCLPPLRTTDDQAALWEALGNGEIQTSASDHTTYTSSQKLGPYSTFTDVPPGFASVQTGFGLLYARGVGDRLITLEQFVAITSANSAKLFGLWPRKGQIAAGADADLVLIDPALPMTITQDRMESASDYDPFEGLTVTGWPETCFAGGEIVYADRTIRSRPGRGRWLFRNLSTADPDDPMTPHFARSTPTPQQGAQP